jgi:hypothetical protein
MTARQRQERARKAGLVGGPARASSIPAWRRSEIARMGGVACFRGMSAAGRRMHTAKARRVMLQNHRKHKAITKD